MLNELLTIAAEAGDKILEIYDRSHGVTFKEDRSPLTLADQASHDHISTRLNRLTPDIPVISEEGDVPDFDSRRTMSRFWLVDPLDGTKEFIKKNGEFTVNIALIEAGRPTLGVVGIPVQGKLYWARRGEGSRLRQGKGEARVLKAKTEFDPRQLTVSMSRSHPSQRLSEFLETLPGHQPKPLGSSLKFCYLAEQLVDFYPRFGPLNEWDTAAAHIIAEESGAVVADLRGQPLNYNKPVMKHHGFIAASSPELMAFLQTKLAEL